MVQDHSCIADGDPSAIRDDRRGGPSCIADIDLLSVIVGAVMSTNSGSHSYLGRRRFSTSDNVMIGGPSPIMHGMRVVTSYHPG